MKAIVILGAAVWANGPSPTLLRRTLHGAQVWQADRDQLLIPCGGLGTHAPTEAQVMREILIAQNVPDAMIFPEDHSTTTLENIRFARPILRQQGVSQITIVTDWTHALRARLVARHFGLLATASCPPLGPGNTMLHLRQMIREALALPVYLVRLHRIPRD